MRLSVFFDHAKVAAAQRGECIGDILRRFRDAGIESVELAAADATDDTIALLRAAGLRVGAVYRQFDFLNGFDTDDRGFLRPPLGVGATHFLIIPGLLRHDDGHDAFSRTIDGVRAVAGHCRAAGLVPMIEDYGDLSSPTCRPYDIARTLDAVPDLSFNFDTGNFAVAGESPLVLYPRFAHRIAYVHAKDRIAKADCGEAVVAPDGRMLRSCAVGAGDIPVAGLLSKMAFDGIDAPIAIECFGAADMLGTILASARFLRGDFGENLNVMEG